MVNHTMQTTRFGVLGLGKTGQSCLRFLTKHALSCVAYDTRHTLENIQKIQNTYPQIPIHLGELCLDLLDNIDILLVSPGLALDLPFIKVAKSRNIPIISDISLFMHYCHAPIIGVTGTNGKSTVVKMLHHMATTLGYQTKLGGNYGTPALDLLEKNVDCYILELSSFQLDITLNLKNHIACFLNCTPDHLDRYKDFSAYIASKQHIYDNSSFQIYNAEDPTTTPKTLHDISCTHASFTTQIPKPHQFGLIKTSVGFDLCLGEERLISSSVLPFIGKHNYANALATLAIAQAMHWPLPLAAKTLETYEPLPHRCEIIKTKPQTDKSLATVWVNDSKSTNVAATIVALESLITQSNQAAHIILILGGIKKQGDDFQILLPLLEKHCKAVIVFGQDSKPIAQMLHAFKNLYCEPEFEAVIQRAKALATEKDTVLFSPACASFDAFKDYVDRGEQFRRRVNNI
jgi:UDP-N-acetylmuramoylalanine--D-glutamate ligase